MEIYLFGGFSIVLIIIIALIFIKDAETNRRFTRYERAIESAMQENFNLKKQIASLANFKHDDPDELDEMKKELEKKIANRAERKDRAYHQSHKEYRARHRRVCQ